MKPSPELVSTMLREDSDAIEQLRQILERERACLEARDHTALPEIIERKNEQLAALGKHASQRQNWLRSAGLSCDHEGWLQWLSQNPLTRAQSADWTQLAEQLQACRDLNDVNGKIIHRAQQTLGQLLNLVRGQENSAPDLYNSKGQAGHGWDPQTLIKV